jgi:hypothetical protein
MNQIWAPSKVGHRKEGPWCGVAAGGVEDVDAVMVLFAVNQLQFNIE